MSIYKLFSDKLSSIQIIITVAINGATMSSKEIDQVSGTAHLYISPKLGYPPAVGVFKDVTILSSDSGEFNRENKSLSKFVSKVRQTGFC